MRLEPLPCTCQKPNVAEEYIYDADYDDVTYFVFCLGCGARIHFVRQYTKGNKIRAKKFARTKDVKNWNTRISKILFSDD